MDNDELAKIIATMLKSPRTYMRPTTRDQRASLTVQRAERQFRDVSRVVNKRKRKVRWADNARTYEPSQRRERGMTRDPQNMRDSASMMRPTAIGVVDVSQATQAEHIARDLAMHRVDVARRQRSASERARAERTPDGRPLKWRARHE
jgi:hypothetical protein